MTKNIKDSKFYIVGGGIASLASAAFLIRDAGVSGKNIFIFEASSGLGGSLDGQKDGNHNYVCRGYRMLEDDVYSSTFDLFSAIPSVDNPEKTILEVFREFNKEYKINAKARLMESGKIIDAWPFQLSAGDRYKLIKLFFTPEFLLENKKISDQFSQNFFKTNFWFEWSTIFGFQPWHSLLEMRRYIIRFLQDNQFMDTASCVRHGKYNDQDFMVLPITNWLTQNGVKFYTNATVKNVHIATENGRKTATNIIYNKNGMDESVAINENDFVFFTLGSMTASPQFGSTKLPPHTEKTDSPSPSWSLWEQISQVSHDFGDPSVFDSSVEKSKLESFTITFKDNYFFEKVEKITGNEAGTGGGITFKNSGWIISITLPHQPFFLNQEVGESICWGYALAPDNLGDFVKKKMIDCSGEEILLEILYQLGLEKESDLIIKSANCIPCLLPYGTSQFMPRTRKNRPPVIPKGSANIAFLGQFVEIPNEIVFTIECSVRSAQIAVYSMLKLKKRVSPLVLKTRSPIVLYKALKTALTR